MHLLAGRTGSPRTSLPDIYKKAEMHFASQPSPLGEIYQITFQSTHRRVCTTRQFIISKIFCNFNIHSLFDIFIIMLLISQFPCAKICIDRTFSTFFDYTGRINMHTAHIAIDLQTKACRLQTCTEHSRSVADLAREILVPCGLGATGYLAGLLHDCGKFTDEFDAYIRMASNGESVHKGSVIHTFAGVRCIMELFHSPEQSMENIAAEIIAVCIGSHHA